MIQLADDYSKHESPCVLVHV